MKFFQKIRSLFARSQNLFSWQFLLSIVFLVLVVFSLNRQIKIIRAEQTGSSPESGADSRLKQLADALTTLDYGSTASGSWGDWGAYWNRINAAARGTFNDAKANGTYNGGNADYPQSVGGIHDATTLPTGSYRSIWTTCNVGNTYCNTGNAQAEKQDANTGLVWSARISSGANWFTANNCAQPGSAENPGSCVAHGDVACKCVKLTSSKTGCEALGTGWRLPYQKELMMAYIDGSAEFLSNSAANYWSGTTNTTTTVNSWFTTLNNGNTGNTTKTYTNAFRCVF